MMGAAERAVEELTHDGMQEKCEDNNREHTQTATPHTGSEAESSGSMVTEEISTPDAKKDGDESTMNCGGDRDDKEAVSRSGNVGEGEGTVTKEGNGEAAGKGSATAAMTEAIIQDSDGQGDSGNAKRKKTTAPSPEAEETDELPVQQAKKSRKGNASRTGATPPQQEANKASGKAMRQETTKHTQAATKPDNLPVEVAKKAGKKRAVATEFTPEVQGDTNGSGNAKRQMTAEAKPPVKDSDPVEASDHSDEQKVDPAAAAVELRDIMKARRWRRMMDCDMLHPKHAEAVKVLKEKNGGRFLASPSNVPHVPLPFVSACPGPRVPRAAMSNPVASHVRMESKAGLGSKAKIRPRESTQILVPRVSASQHARGAGRPRCVSGDRQASERSVHVPRFPPTPPDPSRCPPTAGIRRSISTPDRSPGCVRSVRAEGSGTARSLLGDGPFLTAPSGPVSRRRCFTGWATSGGWPGASDGPGLQRWHRLRILGVVSCIWWHMVPRILAAWSGTPGAPWIPYLEPIVVRRPRAMGQPGLAVQPSACRVASVQLVVPDACPRHRMLV